MQVKLSAYLLPGSGLRMALQGKELEVHAHMLWLQVTVLVTQYVECTLACALAACHDFHVSSTIKCILGGIPSSLTIVSATHACMQA